MAAERWAFDHLAKQGYRLLGHRVRFIWAEIDGVLFRPGEIVLLEVKASPLCPEKSISRSQARRLVRAHAALANAVPLAVRMHLAAVYARDQVDLFEDVLCDLTYY